MHDIVNQTTLTCCPIKRDIIGEYNNRHNTSYLCTQSLFQVSTLGYFLSYLKFIFYLSNVK